jgi:SAM-dependent methyltransferase
MAGQVFTTVLRKLEQGEQPRMQRFGWRTFYNLLARFWRDRDWRFMNYGWLPDASGPAIELDPADESDRPFIGLYDQAVRGLPVEGARVLEVGCGRGGGARYVARYYRPAEVVAVDFSPPAIERARALNADQPNLTFDVGDAERLDFPDNAFDVVINVESSHCYGNVAAFAAEVARVLKPGGWFSFADMRSSRMVDATDAVLDRPEWTRTHAGTITDGALRALDAADARKLTLINRLPVLRRFMREFAGTRGSALYRGLQSGKVVYLSRRYRKHAN